MRIADEEAIIAWDPQARVETFIRRAAFHASTPRFGFLVPTPTAPRLAEVDAAVFDQVEGGLAIIRHVASDRGVELAPTSWALTCVAGSGPWTRKDAVATAPPVRILATAQVAGFDATTLEADDPEALTRWLGDHGFAATPALTAWLARYVAEHWKLTAFVVATDQPAAATYDVATRAVTMTFATERPFYPYREPEAPGAADAPRSLRVMFAAEQRVVATLGDAPWTAAVPHARRFELPGALGLGTRFVTEFVDDSSPRRGTDEVYFAPGPDQRELVTTVRLPPHRVGIPVDALLVVGGVGLWLARRRRRRHRTGA